MLHNIITSRTAHYHTLGELTDQTKEIWFVIHGYGQLAEYFIRKFEFLVKEDIYVIAPEGLSKYYLKSGSDRVGASWMTRHHRLEEIDDQITFLNNVLNMELDKADNKEIRLNFLGFSQGVATLFRWFPKSKVKPHRLIFWSGKLPEEDLDVVAENVDTRFIYGENDEYRDLMNEEKQREFLNRNFPKNEVNTFEGGHEINEELIKQYCLK